MRQPEMGLGNKEQGRRLDQSEEFTSAFGSPLLPPGLIRQRADKKRLEMDKPFP
ncbi:hypothetical protein J22TS3_37360 [Paenibacillus sp. J22TS3]|nr:hypothetical protein J22TS3_37360 [Paenibacillus sp. J22TS3]